MWARKTFAVTNEVAAKHSRSMIQYRRIGRSGMKSFLGVLFALVLVLSPVAIGLPSPVLAVSPSEVWVDDDYWSGGSNDGHTWGWDAFDKIQDGINAVASPGTVHVAAGTYYENITLKNGVEVLGAGAGVTTINGGGSGRVVYGSSVGSTTKLDGFTITNGSALRGGGIYLYNSSPTISNCIFSGNSATDYDGGGMSNDDHSSPTVTNCRFSGNSASFGGGMYSQVSSPMVTNCTFSGNSASDGGGMYQAYSCSPTVQNCIFSGNSANYGGGMYTYDNASPTVENCIFSGNSANYSGGGMYNEYYSSPTVTNCDFVGNSATSGSGGGMYNNDYVSPAIHNNIIVGNTASTGGGIWSDGTSSPTIDYNDVWNNSPNDYSGCSAGPHDISHDPLFVNRAMGDYHVQSSSPCIDTGTNVGAPTEDIEGNPRPIDGNGDGSATTDMGAYEYVPLPPPVGGEAHPVGKMSLLTPWLAVGVIIMVGAAVFALRRRRS